jgi:hypothetical protein
MYGEDEEGNNNFDESKTKITFQQKMKYIMHWFVLIMLHIVVFWYVPISGNIQLYNTPECDPNDLEKYKYGCRNFHANPYLQTFYFLVMFYLLRSAYQIRAGFPILKRASSVLRYNDDPIALLGAQVFMGLPFATELRCILDFTWSKTSLDNFQFW